MNDWAVGDRVVYLKPSTYNPKGIHGVITAVSTKKITGDFTPAGNPAGGIWADDWKYLRREYDHDLDDPDVVR